MQAKALYSSYAMQIASIVAPGMRRERDTVAASIA